MKPIALVAAIENVVVQPDTARMALFDALYAKQKPR